MTVSSVSFVVLGDPVAKGRPRFGRGRTYTPIRTQLAEGAFGWEAKRAIGKPFTGVLSLELTFYVATERRVDLDNLVKLALDAMNGIAYLDDSQIFSLQASRELARTNPRTEVTLTAIGRAAA